MTQTNERMPFDGTFESTNGPLRNDLIFLRENRYLAYTQQVNQPIGYLGVFDFTEDFINRPISQIDLPEHVTREFEAFFYNLPIGARLYKLTDSRALLIRDKGAYIFDVDEQGNLSMVYQNAAYFDIGTTLDGSASGMRSNRFIIWARYEDDNSLIVIENLTSSRSGVGFHVFYRLTYDENTNTLNKTVIFEFPDVIPVPELVSSAFRVRINPVPASDKWFLTFFGGVGGSTPSPTADNRLHLVAFLNPDYSLSSVVPIPATTVDFTANAVVALGENRIVWHDNVGGAPLGKVKIQVDNVLTDVFINTTDQSVVLQTSTDFDDLIPLDSNHYMLQYERDRYAFMKTQGDQTFVLAKGGSIPGTLHRYKESFYQYNKNTFFWFLNPVGITSGTRRVRYSLGRFFQEDR